MASINLLRAYLWGIETGLLALWTKFISRSCEPTYEELKLPKDIFFFLSYNVASLPMRNWNSQEIFQRLKKQSGCEPTYEELKPFIMAICYSIVRSCEPTYEELKLAKPVKDISTSRELRAYLWGIETFLNWQNRIFSFWLRAYLWGIETLLLLLIFQFLFLVASLPMRNWNTES